MNDPRVWFSVALLLLAVLGVFVVLSDFGKAVVQRWQELGRKRTLANEWMELDEDVRDLMQAHLRVAECQVRLASRMEAAPKEFVDEILRATSVGYGLEAAARKLAARHGLYDPSLGLGGSYVLSPENPAPVEKKEEVGDITPSVELVVPRNEPPTLWDGDRLVPRSSKAPR